MQVLYLCVLRCIPAFVAYLVLLIFMRMNLPSRLKRWWQVVLVALAVSLFNVPKAVWGDYSVQANLFRALSVPLALAVLPLLCFKGPVWKRLLVNLLLFAGQVVGEMLALSMLWTTELLSGGEVILRTLADSVSYTVVGTAGSALVDSGVTIFARSLKASRFSGIYVPVTLIILSLGMSYYAYISHAGVLFWLASIALGGCSVVFLLYYVVSLEEKTALETELRDTQHRMALEQSHYRAVEARREELAKIRHDFNNQLAAIRLLMQAGEQKDAQSMLDRLSADLDATRENVYCAVPVVNAVLAKKDAQCRKAGIALHAELTLPETPGIEPLHLCSVLSNLLDNAIHGCTGMEKPVITLTSAMAGDYLFLKTVNPSAPPQEVKAGHGYGTKILRELAEKYDGSFNASYERGVFTAVISLLPKG